MKEKVKRIYLWIKWRIPHIQMAKLLQHNGRTLVEVWRYGNAHSWQDLKLFRIGFSGSWKDPYTSLHIYIWKINIRFGHNPIKLFMDMHREYIIDKRLKAAGVKCPNCGSHKLRESNGFAGEPIEYCKKCGTITYEADPLPYCE
ncbi:MAG: hypothetical protein PVG39_00035 [Desulfobacteraceae bacterium]|jgi:hypothetical protein